MTPRRLFYGLVVLLAIAIIGGGALYVNATNSLKAKVSELELVTANSLLVQERLDSLEALSNQLDELELLIDKSQQILPPEKEQAEALVILAELVRQSGLSARSISFERTSGLPTELSQTRPGETEEVLVMPVTIQTTPGTYAQLQSLLIRIENNARHMQVQNLTITRAGGNQLAFSISVNTYIAK